MLDEKKNALHASRHPSLLPLRVALIAAASESPARPPRMDVNEQRALQLIARMQARYKKVMPFFDSQDLPTSQGLHASVHEMAGVYA